MGEGLAQAVQELEKEGAVDAGVCVNAARPREGRHSRVCKKKWGERDSNFILLYIN